MAPDFLNIFLRKGRALRVKNGKKITTIVFIKLKVKNFKF